MYKELKAKVMEVSQELTASKSKAKLVTHVKDVLALLEETFPTILKEIADDSDDEDGEDEG